eukprot:scaffold493329_cov32-Prasinocladus_malaysianus.AAC.2
MCVHARVICFVVNTLSVTDFLEAKSDGFGQTVARATVKSYGLFCQSSRALIGACVTGTLQSLGRTTGPNLIKRPLTGA